MKIFYMRKLIKYLNENYKSSLFGKDVIWFNKKGDIIAFRDGDTFEILLEILKEGLLKP